VSPEDLASVHPRLYHITRPDAIPSILSHGLLSTSRLLALYRVPRTERRIYESRRRPSSVRLCHPVYGDATLTDNRPLSEAALAACLDDGLSSADWLRMLNGRVFFWVDARCVRSHMRASARRGERRIVLVFDTRGLVGSCFGRVELTAINTGSTMRRPARRGLATFTPVGRHAYREWQGLRGRRDRVKELTVRDGVADACAFLTETSHDATIVGRKEP
jgi:hypothetical protein